MADKVEFELVSPEKLLKSLPVDMVVVPGSEGDFGVLAGHSPLISTLRPGVIDVYEGERIVDRVFVAGGFAEVTETRCTVLAEEAVALSDLDRASVDKAIKNLSEDLDDAKSEADKAVVEAKLVVERAKLDALGASSAAH